MQVKTLMQEIQQLPLQKRFFIMEQTLKSIKNEELKNQTGIAVDEFYDELVNDKERTFSTHLVSEKSLAKDWLSEEDNRWDKVL